MDARGPGVSQVVRKTVVVKMAELSVAGFRDLVSSGVGGLLLLIPPGLAGLSAEAREAVLQLEEELVGGDLEIPVYFAEVIFTTDNFYKDFINLKRILVKRIFPFILLFRELNLKLSQQP